MEPKSRTRADVGMTRKASVPRLREQVRLSAAQFPGMDASALLVVMAMYRAFAVLDRDQAEEVAAAGLTVSQFNVLAVLRRMPAPLSMGELAALLVVRPTNLSGIVGALCDRGLVRRELSPTDQRSVIASLSPAGRRLMDQFLPGHWHHLEALMAGLGERQRLRLVALLRQLMASVQAAPRPAPEGDDAKPRRR